MVVSFRGFTPHAGQCRLELPLVFQLPFFEPVAFPDAGELPVDSRGLDNSHKAGASACLVIGEPCFQVFGPAQVMGGVFVGFSEMN
jgi:hypothetical protein